MNVDSCLLIVMECNLTVLNIFFTFGLWYLETLERHCLE